MGRRCAYCGRSDMPLQKEHVFPSNLYPRSKAGSTVQRLTVLACPPCNNGWSDDEAHFRNVLVIAGEPNAVANELWSTTIARSFTKADGRRRRRDLAGQFVDEIHEGIKRSKIYPGRDPRVQRILKKVIRGLSHYHGIETAVSESRVWADVLRFPLQAGLLDEAALLHRERDVVQYWYEAQREGDIASLWYLRFLGNKPFVGSVARFP